jgi:hypothetical protein
MGVDFAVRSINHQPLIVGLINQDFQQLFPNPFIPPAYETAVRVAPVPVIRRQITPRRTRAHDPENGIDKLPVIFCNTTPNALASRKVRLQ